MIGILFALWSVGQTVQGPTYASPTPGTAQRRVVASSTTRNAIAAAERIQGIGWVNTVSGTPGTWVPFGQLQNVNAVSSNYTATATDHLIRVNTSGGAVTITLPLSSSVFVGFDLYLKDTGNAATHAITVQRNGSDTVDGSASSLSISSNYAHLHLQNAGSGEWDTL